MAHVQYRHAGGEDAVVATETALLRQAGCDVVVSSPRSDEFDAFSVADKARLAAKFADHEHGRRLIRGLIGEQRPDIVHFHSIYPLFGPGAMAEANDLGCGVVQTLHNYRLSCLNGRHFLFGRGELCTRCRPQRFTPGVARGCYRDSRLQSFIMARGLSAQWRRLIDAGLPHVSFAVSDFLRERMLGHGAPAARIVTKPNSVDASAETTSLDGREGVVFVGRLSEEKGVLELVRAWPADGPKLTVVGDGPLTGDVRAVATSAVRMEGSQPPAVVRKLLGSARVCAVPSLWFECMPLVVLEALAEGTPVVAFQGTSVARAVEEIDSSLAVRFGDMRSFVDRCLKVTAQRHWTDLSEACREVHSLRYAHAVNVAGLLSGYELAMSMARARVAQ